MADGALNLTVRRETASRLAAEAEAMGVSPERLAADLLERLLDDPTGFNIPATTAPDYEGPFVDLEDALDTFSAELERRVASQPD